MSVPSDQPQSHEATRTGGSGQRPARALASTLERMAISEVVDQIRSEAAFDTDGRNAQTIVHDGAARIVVTAVDAGRDIGSDVTDACIAFVVIEGSGTLEQGGEEIGIDSGDIATLAPATGWTFHAEQPTAMVTFFWQPA